MKTMVNDLSDVEWQVVNDIDWMDVQRRHNAAYAGLTPEEATILTQMTLAWSKTRHLETVHAERMRQYDPTDPTAMRALDLELAAYAESALAHWQILTDLLGTTNEGVAEAMERTAERMRHIGWIAPQRPCRDDYKTLTALYAKRGRKGGTSY